MRKALKTDQKLVVNIITETFINNPSAVSVLKNKGKKRKKHLAGLAKYVFKTALIREGVVISDDNAGVAVCYRYNLKKESVRDFWNQFLLALNVVGLHRVIKVINREAYIKKRRPADGNFLYFWFFGVKKEGIRNGTARELWNAVLKESTKTNLPIFLETSVEKNKNVYQRFGFTVYDTWDNKDDGIKLWFLKRECI